MSTPTIVPTGYQEPPASYGQQAPPGYWINPENPTQWLTQSDAAKIGQYCFPSGVWHVSGNGNDTALYCGKSPKMDVLVWGGLAVAAFVMLDGNAAWLALIPAAMGFVSLLGDSLVL